MESKPQIDVPYDPRNWPEDFPGENGQYMHQCIPCGSRFIGHKRRLVCKLCAAPQPDAREKRLAEIDNYLDDTFSPDKSTVWAHRALVDVRAELRASEAALQTERQWVDEAEGKLRDAPCSADCDSITSRCLVCSGTDINCKRRLEPCNCWKKGLDA